MESKIEAAGRILDATAEFIAAVYGAGEATRFRQYATDPAAVAAPLTWQARLKADVDTLIKSRPLSPTERARAQPLYEALKRKLAAPSEFDQGLVDSPTGQSFAQFLRDARGAVGDSPFQTLVSPLNDVGGWADLIVKDAEGTACSLPGVPALAEQASDSAGNMGARRRRRGRRRQSESDLKEGLVSGLGSSV